MWVCVSDDFNVETIQKNIITSASSMGAKLRNLNAEQLQQTLRKMIYGKKYLLVLDDIWNENRDKWLKLKALLTNDIRGSKILITTRSTKVAEITSDFPPYILGGLTEDKSWTLFKQMAFKHGIEPKESKLVEIGKCILEKCVGVPLAIRTIGRLLYYNNSEAYWLRFMEDELSKVEQDKSDILPTLKLSYDHLPAHLKQCFAYCALFPKDYVINKELLIDLWIAQGFLQLSNANHSLEDVGNEHFMHLVSRSFLQDVNYDEERNRTTCKIHDLMHDLATLVAGNECIVVKLDATNVDERVRHISFISELGSSRNVPTVLLTINHIRTFLLPIQLNFIGNLNKFNCDKIISSLRYLRTLDLSCLGLKKVSNSIGKLKHLRYLDLSYNEFLKKLPNSITMLRNLQVLKLIFCRSLERLPGEIRKMVNLRCLLNDDCCSLIGIPHGLEKLTSLRTLSQFVLGRKDGKNGELNELNKLNNLRGRLSIEGLENATSKARVANLKAKQHLNFLILQWGSDITDVCDDVTTHEAVLEDLEPHPNLKQLCILRFPGEGITNWLSSLKNLTGIEISNCTRCQHLPALDQLPLLKIVRLDRLTKLEYISEKARNTPFFPSLQELHIFDCFNLKGWWRIDDNNGETTEMTELLLFPCLSKLNIEYCPNLTIMPLYPSIEELVLRETSLKPLQQTMMLISSCTFSASLSKLKSPIIEDCCNLDSYINKYDKQWEVLTSLRYIEFNTVPELVSLPKGIQHVTTLKHLQINDCPCLMALPEEMQLEYLDIRDCPQLLESCGNNMGVEWPKIAHIPNISIEGLWIQKDGCYKLN